MKRRIWLILKHAWRAYGRDNCNQLAAGIAYYVLFSIVPLAIVAVYVFGLVLKDDSLKNDVVDSIVNTLSLSDTDGRNAVENAINGLQAGGGIAAIAGLAGALWTSSAVFGSIRKALNSVWGVYEQRPYVQAKLVDFLQVGGLGILFLASLTITGVVRAVRDASLRYGGPMAGHNAIWEIPAFAIPLMLTFVALFSLYMLVPTARPRAKDAWIGAAVAAVLFEIVKNGFAFYVSNFSNYNVIYGSLAGVFLFLFSTFVASNVLLFGAEIACTVGEMRDGVFDNELVPGPGPPVTERALKIVKGFFVRQQ